MEIIKDNINRLMKRQEMVFENDANLSFDEARKQVAEKVGKDESVIDVYNVKGGFGNQKFMISANVYDSKENLEIIKNMEMSKKKKKEKVEGGKNNEISDNPVEGDSGQGGGSDENIADEKPEEEKPTEGNAKEDETTMNEEKSEDKVEEGKPASLS